MNETWTQVFQQDPVILNAYQSWFWNAYEMAFPKLGHQPYCEMLWTKQPIQIYQFW